MKCCVGFAAEVTSVGPVMVPSHLATGSSPLVSGGVEIERAVAIVAPDLAKQLERLAEVHCADHQLVIPLAVAVIQMGAEEPEPRPRGP
jgi:hypothetical protein